MRNKGKLHYVMAINQRPTNDLTFGIINLPVAKNSGEIGKTTTNIEQSILTGGKHCKYGHD